MKWINNNKSTASAVIMIAAIIFSTYSQAAFYQSNTLAQYCMEYIKMINLEKPVNHFEAGTCSGYIASKIEVMDLSGQLCKKNAINLDDVAKDFIAYVSDNSDMHEHTATYVLVDLLQRKYACEE